MPYAIRRKGHQWEVVNKDTGEVRGTTATRRKAARMVAAIYANTGEGKSVDTLVWFGGSVKALGNGRVGGHLVLFGSPETPDASEERDYFTPDTDFDLEMTTKSRVLYQHGLDPKLGNRKIGVGELKIDDAGVWVEAQLKLRDEYEQAIYKLAEDGKLGWSSGTASHLVRRERQPNGTNKIVAWPLGLDASLTPTPAEPRTKAVALKSLKLMAEGDDESGGYTADEDEADRPPVARRPVKCGDMVKWRPRKGMGKGFGKVVSLHKDGRVPGAENEVDGTEDEPAAKVQLHVHHPEHGIKETGRHLAHPVKHLRHMDVAADGEGKTLKGVYLGDTDEPLALGALDRLSGMLANALYRLILSDQYTTVELVTHIDAALTEYHELVIDAIEALLPDETPGDDAREEMKSLLTHATDRLHAGLSLNDHSDSVLAAAKGLAARLDGLVTLRADSGRMLSRDRRDALKALADQLDRLHDRACRVAGKGAPQPSEVLQLQADLLRLTL